MITTNATIKSKTNKKLIKDDRKKDVISFISNNPNRNIYRISKELKIPRSSLINILNELEDDLEIKSEFDFDKGLKKKLYKVRTVKDFNYVHFEISNFRVKKEFRKLVVKLANNSLNRNKPITIELDDGSEKIIQPGESIDQFLELHL